MPPLKLATFNINNIAKRLAVLLEWLTKASPDIVCLQELKVSDSKFPLRQIEAAGYGARWVGQPSWNGVASLRDTGVDAWVRGLPGASDHAPAWANIETNPPSSTRSASMSHR